MLTTWVVPPSMLYEILFGAELLCPGAEIVHGIDAAATLVLHDPAEYLSLIHI